MIKESYEKAVVEIELFDAEEISSFTKELPISKKISIFYIFNF